MTPVLTYPEAIVIGLMQGVTELFPVSSLGHSVLIPALIGGSWANDLDVSKAESPYLAFIVGLHVATALALLTYFWRDWIRIIGGFFTSIRDRRVETTDQRLAWMIILATIPVGIVGLVGEHTFRVVFGKPIPASLFLTVNGLILLAAEWKRRQAPEPAAFRPVAVSDHAMAAGRAGPGAYQGGADLEMGGGVGRHAGGYRALRQQELASDLASDQRLADMGYVQGTLIGCAQILALLAGISRSGATMAAGLFRGLSHEDAARFAFLLATPVILAAGALKLGDLSGPLGKGIHGQILVGSVLSGIGAYLSVRFLVRYFQTRTLTPFAIYCLIAGFGSFIYLSVR
jgi:undecaprenyl-diphosphatase